MLWLLPVLLGSSCPGPTALIASWCWNWTALRYSSWSCCLLKATWAAMTRCLSAIRLQSGHVQSLHLQNLLWPFKMDTTPWFRQRAHFGSRGGTTLGFRAGEDATLIVDIEKNWPLTFENERDSTHHLAQGNYNSTVINSGVVIKDNPLWKFLSMFPVCL